MGDDLARALEQRAVRVRPGGFAPAAPGGAVWARHATPHLMDPPVAAAAAVLTFAVALAVAHRDVRERSIDVRAIASRRRVRLAVRSLELLARLAERGPREHRQTRPPRSVVELAPDAAAIREVAALLREHPHPPTGAVVACDRFMFHCWNAALAGYDHDQLRRELGRVRFVLEGSV